MPSDRRGSRRRYAKFVTDLVGGRADNAAICTNILDFTARVLVNSAAWGHQRAATPDRTRLCPLLERLAVPVLPMFYVTRVRSRRSIQSVAEGTDLRFEFGPSSEAGPNRRQEGSNAGAH